MHYNAALSEPNPEVDQSENILVTAQPRPGGAAAYLSFEVKIDTIYVSGLQ